MSVDCTSNIVWGGLISDDSSSDEESDDITEISQVLTDSPTDISTTKESLILNSEWETSYDHYHSSNLCNNQQQMTDSCCDILLTSLEPSNPVCDLRPIGGENHGAVNNAVQITNETSQAVEQTSSSFAPSVVYLDGSRLQDHIDDTHRNFDKEENIFTRMELESGNVETGHQYDEPLLSLQTNTKSRTIDVNTIERSIETVLTQVTECNVEALSPMLKRSKILAKKYTRRAKKSFIKKEPKSLTKKLKLNKKMQMKKKRISKPVRNSAKLEKLGRHNSHMNEEYEKRKFELVHKLDDMKTCHLCSVTFRTFNHKHDHDAKFHLPNVSHAKETPRHSLLVEAEPINQEFNELVSGQELVQTLTEESTDCDSVQSTTTQHELTLRDDSCNDVAEIFKCSGCSFEFASEHQMRNHFTLIHVRSALSDCHYCHLKCTQSSVDSSSNYWLSTHEATYSISASLQRCTICGAVFHKNKTAFKRHLGTHKDDKTLQCNTCDLVVNTFDELKLHVMEQVCWVRRENSFCVLLCKTERKLTNGFRNNFVCKLPAAIATASNIPDVPYIRDQIDEKLTDLSFLSIKMKKPSQCSCKCSQMDEDNKDEEGHVRGCRFRKIICPDCGSKLLASSLKKHKRSWCHLQQKKMLKIVDSAIKVGATQADTSQMESIAAHMTTSSANKSCSKSKATVSSVTNSKKPSAVKSRSRNKNNFSDMHDKAKVSKAKLKKKQKRCNWNKSIAPGLTDIVVSNVVSLAPPDNDTTGEFSTSTVSDHDYSGQYGFDQSIHETDCLTSYPADHNYTTQADILWTPELELRHPQTNAQTHLKLPGGLYILHAPSVQPGQSIVLLPVAIDQPSGNQANSTIRWVNDETSFSADAIVPSNEVSASEEEPNAATFDFTTFENDNETSFVVESDGSGDSGFGQQYSVENQSEIEEEELFTTIETSTLASSDGCLVKQEVFS